MQKKLCLALSLTLAYLVQSSPVKLATLQFDDLDSDMDELSYNVEEEDLDDFSRLLDEADGEEGNSNESKTDSKASGFKKKNIAKSGLNNRHNIQNLKKNYKTDASHDQGAYGDNKVYALVEGVAMQAVGINGNEDRTYRKGTKSRGFHRVNHKDEYKKDKVFYDDDETKGTIKKVGAKGHGFRVGSGAGFNKRDFRRNRHNGIYGKHGYIDKGLSDKQYKEYSDSQGFNGSFNQFG